MSSLLANINELNESTRRALQRDEEGEPIALFVDFQKYSRFKSFSLCIFSQWRSSLVFVEMCVCACACVCVRVCVHFLYCSQCIVF